MNKLTKFNCICGQHFCLCANPTFTDDFTRWWEAEHAGCQAAYRAALALVDWLEPEEVDRSWKVDGRWYHDLPAVLGAMQNV